MRPDFSLVEQLRAARPLVHCIANIVTVQDCANIALAAGARPIMAQHPAEMAEIASAAQACVLNILYDADAPAPEEVLRVFEGEEKRRRKCARTRRRRRAARRRPRQKDA